MKLEDLVSVVLGSVFLGAIVSETVHAMFPSGAYGLVAVGAYLLLGAGAMLAGCALGVALGALRPGKVKEVIVAPKCPICGDAERVEGQLIPIPKKKIAQPKVYHSTLNLDMEYESSRRKLTTI